MYFTTAQVANKIFVHKRTLLRWLKAGFLSEPFAVQVPGIKPDGETGTIMFRRWSEVDLARAKECKENKYRKGRGRRSRLMSQIEAGLNKMELTDPDAARHQC